MIASHGLINLVAQATVEILLNSLWQGLALTVLAWLVLRGMRRANAATRYGFLCATLLALIALPIFNGLSSLSETGSVIPPLALETYISSATPSLPAALQTGSSAFRPVGAIAHQEHESAAIEDTTPVEAKTAQRGDGERGNTGAGTWPLRLWAQKIQLPSGNWLLPLFAVWLIVAAMRVGQVCISFRRLHQLKRGSLSPAPEHEERLRRLALECRIERKVRLGSLTNIGVPMVVGLLDPVILFPQKLLEALTADEFELILLHELGHVRRWDDWTNMGQKLIEAVFFFHPAILWVGRRLNLEREIACDDHVISVKQESRHYAVCLARLAELTLLPRRASLAPGAIFSKKQIFSRVELLLKRRRNADPQISKLGLLFPLGLLMAAIIQCLLLSPVFAVSEKPVGNVAQGGMVSSGQATVETPDDAGPIMTGEESANARMDNGTQRQDAPQLSSRTTGEQNARPLSIAEGAPRNAATVSGNESLMDSIAKLSSSWDKADALIAVLGQKAGLDSVPASFFEVLKTIPSPMDKTRVLSALLTKRPGQRLLTQTLKAITFLETESDKRDLLIKAARICPNDDGVLGVYLQVAAVLHSSSDQDSALSALLDRSDLSRNILLRMRALALDKIASTQSQQHVVDRVNLRLTAKDRVRS